MDLEVLKIAADSDNNRNIEKRTHTSKLKNSLDLKYIFKNETKTVYRDRCCRFNDYGLNAIASEISKYIGQNY